MGQLQSIEHEIDRSHKIDSDALKREFSQYCKFCGSKDNCVDSGTALKFVKDMTKILGLRENIEILSAIDAKDKSRRFNFAECRLLFLQLIADTKEAFDLSESLNVETSKKKEKHQHVEVEGSSLLAQQESWNYTPPGQIMSREWSLIFNELDPKDLNEVNLTCKFFRSVLTKYPPDSWRVACLSTLEERTSENIGVNLNSIEKMRTIVRLEIGTPGLGTMLLDKDIPIICANLKSLKCMKLIYCHLIHPEGFSQCQGLDGAMSLQSLTLMSMKVPMQAIVRAFPNLADFVVCSGTVCDMADHRSFVSYCLDLLKLSRLGIGEMNGIKMESELGIIDELCDLRVKSLWLDGQFTADNQDFATPAARHARHLAAKRNCFNMSEEKELEILMKDPLKKSLAEYIAQERSPEFEAALAKSGIKYINCRNLPYETPRMLSYSWRTK